MRNPWPVFSIAALSGAVCLIYDHFFSYETMWIAVVAFLALLALCFFAYCRYECWLAKKLNPYVLASLGTQQTFPKYHYSKLVLCSAGTKALGRSRRNFGTVFASSQK